MGKKYASIHILTDKPENEIFKLGDLYKNSNSMIENMQRASKVFKNTEAQQLLNRFFTCWENEIIIVRHQKFVSIYDESLSFESIEEKAKIISKNVDQPVLYTSNFDDDVFIFGIFQIGKKITQGNIGDGLCIYGLTPKKIDFDKFFRVLEINKNCSQLTGNIDLVEKEMQELLQISLNIKISDVQDNERYDEIIINDGLYI